MATLVMSLLVMRQNKDAFRMKKRQIKLSSILAPDPVISALGHI